MYRETANAPALLTSVSNGNHIGATPRPEVDEPKSVIKSDSPWLFHPGSDPRRGRGPQKGAPNAGRPLDRVRNACARAFDERVELLKGIADGTVGEMVATPAGLVLVPASLAVRLRALEMLARYGLGPALPMPPAPPRRVLTIRWAKD